MFILRLYDKCLCNVYLNTEFFDYELRYSFQDSYEYVLVDADLSGVISLRLGLYCDLILSDTDN